MHEGPLVFEVFTGIHDDPRIQGRAVVFGLGSYIPSSLPPSLEYVYIVITNTGATTLALDEFFLESGPERTVLHHLDVPSAALHEHVLEAGAGLVIGFLRDLFTMRLRFAPDLPDPMMVRAGCTTRGGGRWVSAPHLFGLNYPAYPVQDAELSAHTAWFARRTALYQSEMERIRTQWGSLRAYASLHEHFGMHTVYDEEGRPWWLLREWMPAATKLWLATDHTGFALREDYAFTRVEPAGVWELRLPREELPHGTYIELRVASPQSTEPARRVPAFALRVEQDTRIKEQWCARVWAPAQQHVFRHDEKRQALVFPRIYEAHIGIAQARDGRTADSVGTFFDFTRHMLPRIAAGGYTAVQLMGVLEHPLYKSFGYQVSSYFAPSSRFGTPEELCELVDEAHNLGLAVILDIPHSHAAPNTEQGIASYDTSAYFFADKDNQWGTRSFDYSKDMTRRFLLSNCCYWMEHYHVDGFRFDAVGNMIYVDHGFGDDFSHADRCFVRSDGQARIDEAGVLYLELANTLIHECAPHAVTLAEEFSGMPGMTSPPEQGGLGFDYRFAMGLPDFWGKFIKEDRSIGSLWYEMTNRRSYERTVSYVACHDQCINGKDAMIWRLIGDAMYTDMSCFLENFKVSRGVAIYKLMRLVTMGTAGHGFLNFMGDEFGHPEWIDAEEYGHRQWQLAERTDLKYAGLLAFDHALLALARDFVRDFAQGAWLRHIHEADRSLVFERGHLLFAFNFHETRAMPRLDAWVTPGKYVEWLSTDNTDYAGHGNLHVATSLVPNGTATHTADQARQEHFTVPEHGPGGGHRISLYLPPCVGLVLVREPATLS